MNRRSRLAALLAGLAALLLPGCDSLAPKSAEKSTAPAKAATSTPKLRVMPKGPPRIACDKPVHDYGTVSEGSTVKHVFVVKNAGGAPLTIKRAAGG